MGAIAQAGFSLTELRKDILAWAGRPAVYADDFERALAHLDSIAAGLEVGRAHVQAAYQAARGKE